MNSERRNSKDGKTLIPINIDGANYEDSSIKAYKTITMMVMAFILFIIVLYAIGQQGKGADIWLYLGLWLIGAFYIGRFVIFEEKAQKKNMQNLKKYAVTTPALFWNIPFVKDTQDGAIVIYADGKVGVIVKFERDTISGLDSDAKENHFDAVSDFIREITLKGYSHMMMDIMEPSGEDPRFKEMDREASNSDNKSIRKFMESQVGYIKNLARNSLYDNEYYLIYTFDTSKIDNILSDVVRAVNIAMDGCYIGYKILRKSAIVKFIQQEDNVKFFNINDAMIAVNNANMKGKIITLKSVKFDDGTVQDLDIPAVREIEKELNDNSKAKKLSIKKLLKKYRSEVSLKQIVKDNKSESKNLIQVDDFDDTEDFDDDEDEELWDL